MAAGRGPRSRFSPVAIVERYGLYLLTLISPALSSRVSYWRRRGEWINLKHPATFYEKLQWLKLYVYRRDPLVAQCADKLRVRDYVRDCGLGDLLNELYGSYKRAGQVPWDALPPRFALKWNFGSGMNIVCADAAQLDRRAARRQMRRWGFSKCWLLYAETHYGKIPRRILLEKYLATDQGALPNDYKIYCFHGVARCVLVAANRDEHARFAVMTPDWRLLGGHKGRPLPEQLEKPACLPEMLRAAEILSAPFPFVRVDFYAVDGRPVFGEMTFTPGAAIFCANVPIDGVPMGDLIRLPERAGRRRA
ncbi:MAG: glycosyl transferase [Clostridiales bacterium]|nr:glycosyl transferase [Clostridiales bacterium]